MKPAFNQHVRYGRVSEFSWRYCERKVGTYLTYDTPRVASADGRLAFSTRVVWRPRWKPELHGEWSVRRTTYRTIGATTRCRRDRTVTDTVVLSRLSRVVVPSEWVVRGQDANGDDIEVPIGAVVQSWTEPTVSATKRWGSFDAGEPSEVLFAKMNAFVTGCAAQGEFTPLADWLVESVPPLAFLFTGPGDPT